MKYPFKFIAQVIPSYTCRPTAKFNIRLDFHKEVNDACTKHEATLCLVYMLQVKILLLLVGLGCFRGDGSDGTPSLIGRGDSLHL